jgi:hypothetical protein
VVSYALISYSSGICLNPVNEARRVFERFAALERVSSDTNTFWIDPRCRSTIVLLQDRVQHVRESVDGCQKSLTTMYSVMLPWNPLLENFGQLLEVFRTSRCIYRLIQLNLRAGANFALGWVRKWHSRLNFVTMSLGLPSSQIFRTVELQIHMDARLEPARRMIARLLEADASFFREYHCLNPLHVDPSDQVEL